MNIESQLNVQTHSHLSIPVHLIFTRWLIVLEIVVPLLIFIVVAIFKIELTKTISKAQSIGANRAECFAVLVKISACNLALECLVFAEGLCDI